MKNKQHRLLIDASSILRAAHHAGHDAEFGRQVIFEEKKVFVNSGAWGFENFMTGLRALLNMTGIAPFNIVLVKDGRDSRALRRAIYPKYKANRPERAPEMNAEYKKALTMAENEILALGGMSVVQDGMEADDVLAYLSINLEGRTVIWSRDKDMLALHSPTCDIYIKDQMNPEIIDGCPAAYVDVYKAVVGDTSDNFPGAKGFGAKSFTDMVLKFGYEGLECLRESIVSCNLGSHEEDVPDFKPLQKIIDAKSEVYLSHACALLYPHKINTSREPLQVTMKIAQATHPLFVRESQTKTLLTADNFDQELAKVLHHIARSPRVSLDIETSVTDEGEAWCKAIDDSKKGRKSDTVDVFGAKLAGMSLTFGDNLQHTLYCSVDHVDTNNCSMDQVMSLVEAIPAGIPVAVHNANFELPVLYENWGVWVDGIWDTKDMCSYVNENISKALKSTAKAYFDYDQVTYAAVTTKEGLPGTVEGGTFVEFFMKEITPAVTHMDVVGPEDPEMAGLEIEVVDSPAVVEEWERRKYRMNQLSAQHVFDYACDDTIVTAAVFTRTLLVMEIEHTMDAFLDCELESNYWTAKSYVEGVPVDLDLLKELELEDDDTFATAWAELREYLFTVNWPGTYFTPYELTPAGIKEAFLQITGEKFECRARMPGKIADALIEQGQSELAEILLSGDQEAFDVLMQQYFVAEPDFDINKDDHLRVLFYETLKLPIRFRTRVTDIQRAKGKREGTPQTDTAVQDHALKLDVVPGSQEERVLQLIRTTNQINTRKQLYYTPFVLYAHWKDGRIHANLGKNMTATRRFAPSGPNVNQLPKKGDGKKVRSVFRAPEGYVVCAMDFSGQELRGAAQESQDEMLLSCYIGDNKRDPHSLAGSGIALREGSEFGDYAKFEAARHGDFGDAAKEVVKNLRNKGKGTMFSSQYLCRAPKLAKLLVVDVDEAQRFLDAKNEVYWGLAQWQQDTIKEAHAQGYVTTRLGARRHLHYKLSSADKWEAMEAERQSVNFKIQASGAEMTKRAINAMSGTLENYGAHFWFPVHDEIVIIIPISNLVPCIQEVHACMIQNYAGMTVPLESEISIGWSYGELEVVGILPTEENINAALIKISEV